MQSVAPRLTLFRFPYGACNERALREVHDQGLVAIQWDISTGDPSPQQSAAAIVRAMTRAKPGSIILNHANGRGWHTAAALPIAIDKLRKSGFEFVTVSELLAAGQPVVSPDCYDSRPGDTNRYDNLARRIHPLLKETRSPLPSPLQ
jgi:peptidoglycan/xylan/chitin deacetylase (PgdA/CDA1 family)